MWSRYYWSLRHWAGRYWTRLGAGQGGDAVPMDFCCTNVRNLTPGRDVMPLTPIRMVRSLTPARDVRDLC